MLGEGGTSLEELVGAIRKYQAREVDPRDDDLKVLGSGMDGLESEFSAMAGRAQQSGEHLLSGTATAATWISRTCNMSVTAAADRLRVGEQLVSLPKVAAALSSGEIGYQSASLLCHLRDWLDDKREIFDDAAMLAPRRRDSVFGVRIFSH